MMLNPQFTEQLLSRIEDAGINASAPPQQRWVDGWIVRFSPGKAKRARCVNAVAEGRTTLAERLEVCQRLYARTELPLVVRITPFTVPTRLDGALEALGYTRFDDTRVMVLAQLPAEAPVLPDGMTIEPLGLEPFARLIGRFRGSPLAQQQAHAQRLLESPVPFHPYELRERGTVIGCGQFALEDDLAGLYDVFTTVSARGRGVAGLLCRHMLFQAGLDGGRHGYLQVEGDNHAARAVYHRLGFADGYAYHYRAAKPPA